jgi:hypothetical protein
MGFHRPHTIDLWLFFVSFLHKADTTGGYSPVQAIRDFRSHKWLLKRVGVVVKRALFGWMLHVASTASQDRLLQVESILQLS